MLIRFISLGFLKKWFILSLILLLVVILIVFPYGHVMELPGKFFQILFGKYEILTFGCMIKYFDPHDSKLVEPIEEVNCGRPRLVKVVGQYIQVDKDKEKFYLSKQEEIICYYQENVPITKNNFNRRIRFIDKKNIFYEKVKFDAEADLLEVVCYLLSDKRTIYRDYFTILAKQPPNHEAYQDKPWISPERHNVLVLGIDAISRLGFLRNYPKTSKYIQEHLHVIKFPGYHKVRNSLVHNEQLLNLISGVTPEQLELCMSSGHFDNCPQIWERFTVNGYFTAYGEDLGYLGPWANYSKFLDRPTDYFWSRINMRIMEGFVGERGFPHCVGESPAYQRLFDYIKQILNILSKENFFGIFWSYSLSHSTKQTDEDLLEFIQYLHKRGTFEDTFLFLLSGKGQPLSNSITVDSYPRAKMEKYLPLFWMVLPNSFSSFHHLIVDTLQVNSGRLLTIFDIHNTIKSIAFNFMENPEPFNEYLPNVFYPISIYTSCRSLGIPDEICACD